MQISTKDWINYISKLTELSETAGNLMKEYVGRNGFGDTDAIIDYAYALVTKYGNGTATLAAAMYDAIAEMQGKIIPPAEPAPTSEYGNVAKAVNGTIKKSKNLNTIGGTINRLVKKASTDTMLINAARDGAEYAWVPMGDTCAFCITLASRGWLSISRDKLKNHRDHLHSNCDCTYAVRFDGKSGVAGYDPDKYLEIYQNAEGTSSEDKINSIRRMYYAEHKDMINAQKRAAYVLRKDNFSKDDNTGIINGKSSETGEPELLRIPQIPASTISKKVEEGEYSLRLTQQSYDKHIPGTQTYQIYADARNEKGETPQAILLISKEEAQKIIYNQSGTGIIKVRRDGTPSNVEWITCDKVIGMFFNGKEYIPTNKVAIHHGRKGSHLVPIRGNNYD